MPIYEYEPIDRDCLICENRLELLQSINGDSKTSCPYCGMDIKRIVSKAAFKMEKPTDADRAAAKVSPRIRGLKKVYGKNRLERVLTS